MSRKPATARVAVVGLGDLGTRIAAGLASKKTIGELTLIGRHQESGQYLSWLVSACRDFRVRFVCLDALNSVLLSEAFKEAKPDLIVQCGSLLSPWAHFERNDSVSRVLKEAGFALQLSAQLPIITSVMRAVRMSGRECLVVNCSYPDVTHCILDRHGLAPTVGVGNVGIVLGIIKACLKDSCNPKDLRLFAHHSHVSSVVHGRIPSASLTVPKLFDGDSELPVECWTSRLQPMTLKKDLNAITASHALTVISALLAAEEPFSTAVPGPNGLPGGWPVRIFGGRIELDLPSSVSVEDATTFNHNSAKQDGVESIGRDGTVYFTSRLASCVADLCPELASPMHPDEAFKRYVQLETFLKGA